MKRRTLSSADTPLVEPEQNETAERIFALYKNAMYRTAYDVLRDEWQAEDAVMDALAKICAHPERFEGLAEKNLKLLVMRTVENAALDRYRRRRRIAEHEEPDAEGCELPGYESAEEILLRDEAGTFGSLSEGVRHLPENYRQVILLRYGEDYTNREIAEMLSIPESTVATRLSRAREILKKEMEESHE